MAAIQGLRGTGQFTSDFRPTNYRELFTLLEPNGTAPLQALLAMTSSESTDDPKYNHFRDELPTRTIVVNGALNNSATTLTFDNDTADEAFIVSGTVLHNPATGENILATADANTSANTVTIQRGYHSTAAAVADDQELIIAGSSFIEGGTSPTAVSFDATVDHNFTQIFKTAISVSGTLQNTNLRTGDKEQEQLTKALKLHMGDIERAFFFGTRGETNGSTANPKRTTGGLFSMVTNVIDCASATASSNKMTEKEFDKFLIEDIFAFGSNEKVAFAGPRCITNMMELGKNRWQPVQIDNAYGVAFTRYTTFAGDLLVYMHPMFRQVNALSQEMLILDMNHLNYRYMAGRDTQLVRDIQNNDFDGVKHMYMSECGLEMTHSKVHHRIKNWSALS
tara:strand:+ start:7355 stop:8536 length:1182 start_codon:yes stop_codon:yes gene_type:complete